ncbi:MAG: PrsW family intramembrane metalloprotease, partial [Methylococcales bacterium]|nr:PrsW family intramembrane metalloprotease [Methylococcales bacterium]
ARSFYTAGVHACSTAVFGGCIGYAKYTRFSHKILMLIIGFSLAVMIHSFWNSFLTVSQITNDPFLAKLPFAILPIICILLVVILQFCLMRESEILEIELTSESQNYQTLPIEHVAFIKSYINRSKNGWLSDNISKKQYCAKTTELAFLRQHYWRADEKNRHILELKMNKLRTEIQQLLSYSV